MATKKLKANDSNLGIDSKTYNYSPKYLRLKTVDQAPGNYWHYEANRAGESMSTVLISGFFNGSTLSAGDTLKVNATDTAGMFDISVSNGVVTLTAMGGGGEPGPQGPKGDQGEKGEKGDQGIQGIKGDTGAAGKDGAQGVKGDTGATGPQGATGATGAQGIQGVKGEQGIQGPKGDQGDPGNNVTLTFPVYMMSIENGVRSHDITIRSISGSNQGIESGIVSQSSGLVRLSKLLSFLVEEKQTLKVTCRVLFHNLDTITATNYYVNAQGLGVTVGGQYVNVGKEQTIQLDKTKYKTNVVTFTIEDTTVTQLIAVGFRLHLQYADGATTAIFGEAVISGSLT